jgi:hypothetical protein
MKKTKTLGFFIYPLCKRETFFPLQKIKKKHNEHTVKNKKNR